MRSYKSLEELETLLTAPAPASEIEWKPTMTGKKDGKVWIKLEPCRTSRSIITTLDEVFGPAGWENGFVEWMGGNGVLCELKCNVMLPDPLGEKNEDGTDVMRMHGITKRDGAANSSTGNVDTDIKGGFSNSQQRAAVQLGIGRDLCFWPEFFVSERADTVQRERPDNSEGWRSAKVEGVHCWYEIPTIPLDLLPESSN